MEFRYHDRINRTQFDMISGDLEPKQTAGLAYLLSKSEASLNAFLKLAGIKILQFDKYIVDAEAHGKNFNNHAGRIDILLRFYKGFQPIKAIIIEAKSIKVNTSAQVASQQVVNYLNGDFEQLSPFRNVTEQVTITRYGAYLNSNVIHISWSQLISALFPLRREALVDDYIHFLLNISGAMNYYEEEIQAIAAGKTINAVRSSGIYECPAVGRRYAKQRRTLYIAMKNGRGGDMDTLYKVKEIFDLDMNDNTGAIDSICKSGIPDFKERLECYKNNVNYNTSDHTIKRVFVLDLPNSIILPNIVRPMENNANWPYYKLVDFLVPINSNIGRVIVQDNVKIIGNLLSIDCPPAKRYTIKSNNAIVNQISGIKTDIVLVPHKKYSIEIEGINRGGSRCVIEAEDNLGFWQLSFIF